MSTSANRTKPASSPGHRRAAPIHPPPTRSPRIRALSAGVGEITRGSVERGLFKDGQSSSGLAAARLRSHNWLLISQLPMLCPRCSHSTPVPVGRCPACGATFPDATVATDVMRIDTTGLPPGATFGASTGSGPTVDAPSGATIGGKTMGAGSTMGATIGATIGGATPHSAVLAGPLRIGQSFSARYHIIKVLGVGGMGAVYQAWDAELSVAVALKVIRIDASRRSASSEAEKRFKQELLLARQVTHKNVVRIHDLGEIDGIKYITMPYVKGDDLSTVLRRDGKLPVARALEIARQIAGGLGAAHDAGVVHRDLKPANIMISADGLALIMDFGISASSEEATSGGIVGTLEYMAPEQSTGAAVDGRADIYAFGLILYEMLTGPRVVSATSARERIRRDEAADSRGHAAGWLAGSNHSGPPRCPRDALHRARSRCAVCDDRRTGRGAGGAG